MKNGPYKMHKQVKQIQEWLSGKRVLLFVLIFSTAVFVTSIFLFVPPGNLTYPALSVFILPCVAIFFFLRVEIARTKKISENQGVKKENYRVILNSLGEGLITTDKKGRVVFMNPAAERFTGWNWREAKKKMLHKVFNAVNEKTGNPVDPIVSRILKEGKKIEWENNILLKSKNACTFVISNNGSPMLDLSGSITGAVLVFNDITEKDKNEKELKESEKQYRSLIQNLPEAVYTCDEDGFIKLYNKAAVELWGREPVTGKDLWCGFRKIFNTDGTDLPPDTCPMAICLKEGMPVHGREMMVQRPDESFRQVLSYPTPLFNTEGKLTGAINMMIDVTSKKEKEILIQKTEEKYHSLIDQASDAILIYSFDGTIHEFNKSCYTLLGYTAEEFSKLKLSDILVENIIVNPENNIAILAGETKTLTSHLIRKEGAPMETEITVKMLADGKVIAFARDITDSKKTEKEIKRSNERFKLIGQATNDVIWEWNLETNELWGNEMHQQLYGLTLADPVPADDEWKRRLHADDRERVIKNIEDTLTSEKNTWDGEYRMHTENKGEVYIYGQTYILRNNEGKPVRMIGSMMDITERKKAEHAIKKEKELSDSIINSLPGVFYFYDENLKLLRWNKQLENVTGYSAAELKEMNPADFFEGEDRMYMRERSRKVFSAGSGDAEASFTTKAGKKIPFYFTGLRMQNEGKPSLLGIGINITERKESETKTKQAIERYDLLARATSDTIWDWDIVNNKMLYNYGITQMLGYQKSEVENVVDWWNEKLHPDDIQKVTESLETIFEKGLQRFQLTYRFRCADGLYKHIFDRAFVVFDESGKPYRMIGAMQDITYQVEEEIRISKAIIDAQEVERRNIGRELHDNVNQILGGSLIALGMVKESKTDSAKATEYIETTKGYIGDAVDEIRKLSHHLAPPTFDDISLKDVFETLLFSINLDNRFTINFHIDELNETVISDDIQINLYRILQEQVKNIIKYAEAGTIEVLVTLPGPAVRMRIFDNGKGFDTKASKNGIGLSNIKKRAESLSGKFLLNSAPGKGCEIIVEIPLTR
jgi:PAS domain S-box-containing protein